MDKVIEFKEVFFSYQKNPVLHNVNLSVREKDFTCLVGPNGGGKTTILKLVLGLIHPNSGTISIFGSKPSKVSSMLGYVPQHAKYDARFPVNVLDVVLMGCLGPSRIWGKYSREDRENAKKTLEDVGMADFQTRQFSELSGGQRQRVLVARALVSEPKLLLLDEPTANIDIHGSEYLYDMLQKLNNRMTIVMVSHDLGFVSQYVKSVICIRGEAVVHPTSQITGDTIKEMYGVDIRLIRHDHNCSCKEDSH
ncbi:MAG: metal ABC transporter ATP-binding protein [Candidatus Riflebacteria bacterium]|nr:metal ABC transporter ATP-binding protein [Candidatus Riflebacteria bacterium]